MRHVWIVLVAALWGCAAPTGVSSTEPGDSFVGKYDTFFDPTDHGEIPTDGSDIAWVSAGEQFHTWTFTLTGPSTMTITTNRPDGEPGLDTTLYLHRFDSVTGLWGRSIARNDNREDSLWWSGLEEDLDEGAYQVKVKAALEGDTGAFVLDLSCTGDGCTPTAEPSAQ